MSDKYCHGVVNCKYYDGYHGDCTFMSMGSGNPDDMPCRVHAKSDYQNTVSKFNIASLNGYESPIEVMFRDIENRIREQEENAITAEVSRQMAVNIDKNELMKALAYDRDQYHKGYEDAKRAYERQTIRHVILNHPRFGKCDACYDEARQLLYFDCITKELLDKYGWTFEEGKDDEEETN